MATLPVIRYELDPTGINPNNLVAGEIHTLVARQIRPLAPTYGAFYSASVKIRDLSTNQLLVPGVQYYAAELYEMPTAKFGKEICGILLITDPSVSSDVSVDYQALGGEFSYSAQAIVDQIEALNLDNRPVQWGSLIAKPAEYPPSEHLHDVGDIYGFEYVVDALERVRSAILMGDSRSHDQIYSYIDSKLSNQGAVDSAQDAALSAHVNNMGNPHAVTAAQVGAYSKAQADAITNAISTTLSGHTANLANPHNVTAAQLGVYLKAETLSAAQVDTHISDAINAYNASTIATLTGRVSAVEGQLGAHVVNTANPHGTTAGQVGAYTKAEVDAKLVGVASATRGNLEVRSFSSRTNFSGSSGGAVWYDLNLGRFCLVMMTFSTEDNPAASTTISAIKIYRNGVQVGYAGAGGVVLKAGDILRIGWDNTGTAYTGTISIYDL